MKNRLYKVGNEFISTPNSEQGKLICNTIDIIPTKENGKMILFEVTDNKSTEFITAEQASTALDLFFQMHKPITLYTKVICFVNDIKTI
jgi:hypothetical protein